MCFSKIQSYLGCFFVIILFLFIAIRVLFSVFVLLACISDVLIDSPLIIIQQMLLCIRMCRFRFDRPCAVSFQLSFAVRIFVQLLQQLILLRSVVGTAYCICSI